MNNIQESSKKIKKIYENLSYFDQYGSQIFLFVILSVIVFLVYSYCAVMLNIQPIKDDWVNQRCNPKVMPFAGFINKPPDKSITDFTQENFTYCVQNILKSITGYAVQPITYTTNVLQKFYLSVLQDIQKIRELMSNVRSSMGDVANEVMSRILNMMIPLQQIIIGMKDVLGKIQGILTAALFTGLGSYYALKSLLGAIVEFIVIILSVLAALILVLWILPFTWPFAAANSAIFVAIAVPLTIIIVFLTQVMDIHSSVLPQLKAPDIRCFDENTAIELFDGTFVPICNISLGDILQDGSSVTAKMKVDAQHLDMYLLDDTIVSGCHMVKYNDLFLCVSNHPRSKKLEKYEKPHVYCFNATNKIIIANGNIFLDWDELYGKTLEKAKRHISTKFKINLSDITNNDIHKYLDGGIFEKTPVRMIDGTLCEIKDVKVNDVLENGVRVYAFVEVGGKNIHTETEKEIEINVASKPGKLYHLVTDKGYFKIGNYLVNDYNSYSDFV